MVLAFESHFVYVLSHLSLNCLRCNFMLVYTTLLQLVRTEESYRIVKKN